MSFYRRCYGGVADLRKPQKPKLEASCYTVRCSGYYCLIIVDSLRISHSTYDYTEIPIGDKALCNMYYGKSIYVGSSYHPLADLILDIVKVVIHSGENCFPMETSEV